MELKKAITRKVNYPSKEAMKPMLLGMGIALTLSACVHSEVKQPKKEASHGSISASENLPPKVKNSEEQNSSRERAEVPFPMPTGGVPPLPEKSK